MSTQKKQYKLLACAVMALLCPTLFAASITVSNAVDLAQAISDNVGTFTFIYLEPGFYDVSAFAQPSYDSSGNPGVSKSNLSLDRVNLRGKTSNPRDTVIYNSKGDNRIFFTRHGRLEHMTVSNGCANASNGGNGGGCMSIDNQPVEATNVIVTCCTATVNGGGVYAGKWYDCEIVGNHADSNGGGACGATGAQGVKLRHTRVFGNTCGGNGGGCWFGYVTEGCVISNNTSSVLGGGLYSPVEATDSYIRHNRVVPISGKAGKGAGVFSGTLTRCLVDGNAIVAGASTSTRYGGGVSDSTCMECIIVNNFVAYPGTGAGTYAATCTECIISNNVPCCTADGEWGNGTGVAAMKGLVNCDLYGMSLDPQCAMLNCRIHGYTNGYYLAKGVNIGTNGCFKGLSTMCSGLLNATNCLFTSNRMSILFSCEKAAQFSLVNCTVASNRADSTFAGFSGSYAVCEIMNTILSANLSANGSSRRDMYISSSDDGHFNFSHCLIGTNRKSDEPQVVETATVVSDNPRFDSENPVDPFALERRSPARNKGLVMGWMTDATDIRNTPDVPRMNFGKVDIGCYQCWYDPIGLMLLVR